MKVGERDFVNMDSYLSRVTRRYVFPLLSFQIEDSLVHSDSTKRKFTAADGNVYIWARKADVQGQLEWQVRTTIFVRSLPYIYIYRTLVHQCRKRELLSCLLDANVWRCPRWLRR